MYQISITERIDALKTIFLFWNEHLSPTEMKLLGWLAANTIGRGKVAGNYSHEQIVRGVQKYDSDEYWCKGVGMSLSSVRRGLETLNSRGVIGIRPSQKGAYIRINLDWEPQASAHGEHPPLS